MSNIVGVLAFIGGLVIFFAVMMAIAFAIDRAFENVVSTMIKHGIFIKKISDRDLNKFKEIIDSEIFDRKNKRFEEEQRNFKTGWDARQEELDDLKDTIIQLENQNESLKGEVMFLEEERADDHLPKEELHDEDL